MLLAYRRASIASAATFLFLRESATFGWWQISRARLLRYGSTLFPMRQCHILFSLVEADEYASTRALIKLFRLNLTAVFSMNLLFRLSVKMPTAILLPTSQL